MPLLGLGRLSQTFPKFIFFSLVLSIPGCAAFVSLVAWPSTAMHSISYKQCYYLMSVILRRMDDDRSDVQQIEESIAKKAEEELEFLSLDEVGMFLEELVKHRR